jgi:hypothetical protein
VSRKTVHRRRLEEQYREKHGAYASPNLAPHRHVRDKNGNTCSLPMESFAKWERGAYSGKKR